MRSPLIGSAALTLGLALACGTSPEAEPEPEPAPEPAKAAPTPAPTAAIPAGKAEDYSDSWLIILSSKRELGVVPDGVATLRASDLEHDLRTLSSSEFKALNPCYEIVVAQRYDDRADAVAYSKALTALGIDNYPRNAGKWVGKQPRVDAWCEDARAGLDAACPGEVRFTTDVDGHTAIDLGLDAELHERVVEGAPAPRRVDEMGTAWRAPLAHQTVGSMKVGDTVHGYAPGETGTCTVTGFSILVQGEPHWSWHDGDRTEPGCGAPTVHAELDCDVAAVLTGPDAKARLAAEVALEPADPRAGSAEVLLEQTETMKRHIADAEATAEGSGLFAEVHHTLLTLGDREFVAVLFHWWTGDGFDQCGGDDLNQQVLGIVELGDTPKALVNAVDAYEVSRVTLLERGDELSLLTWGWNQTTVSRLDGEEICTLSYDYCDCGC